MVEVDTARKNDGATPLFQATTQGVVDVARVLLEHGADTKKLSSDMQAPIKIRCRQRPRRSRLGLVGDGRRHRHQR